MVDAAGVANENNFNVGIVGMKIVKQTFREQGFLQGQLNAGTHPGRNWRV